MVDVWSPTFTKIMFGMPNMLCVLFRVLLFAIFSSDPPPHCALPLPAALSRLMSHKHKAATDPPQTAHGDAAKRRRPGRGGGPVCPHLRLRGGRSMIGLVLLLGRSRAGASRPPAGPSPRSCAPLQSALAHDGKGNAKTSFNRIS